MNSERRRLISYVSPLRPDGCFLIANPVGSGRLVMQPGLDCEALLPLGLSRPDATQRVSFYHLDTGQWVCAEPPHDGADLGVLSADRDKIDAWEEFTLVPIPCASVSSEMLSLALRLDTMLREPLSIETVLALPRQDAPILQAIARMSPYDSLAQLARALLMSPEACRKLAQLFPCDVLGTFGLPALSAWVSVGRNPPPQLVTINTGLNPLPPLERMLGTETCLSSLYLHRSSAESSGASAQCLRHRDSSQRRPIPA